MGRGCVYPLPRKRLATITCFMLFFVITLVLLFSLNARIKREEDMEKIIASMNTHLQFLESQYQVKQEDIYNLQSRFLRNMTGSGHTDTALLSPEVVAILKNISGSKAAAGLTTRHIPQLRTPFVYQLLPHLMSDPCSLKPAYHMTAGKSFVDYVIGIPTVRRDKENYLPITVSHLVAGLSKSDSNSTLIVVMVGDTDLEYVLKIAKQLETIFPKEVANGLIEVISPAPSYYPNFDNLPQTLGDSKKRAKWRTKQNLDTIYLMAYAYSKGTFYLMLEDDVVAKKDYLDDIKKFTASVTVVNPHWFYIDFSHVGGIGKLFRSVDLLRFINYVQMFYINMPIDWLLESYLADLTCTIEKLAKKCQSAKDAIRPRYLTPLFQHIGVYSSLRGKIQKIKDSQFGPMPLFFPHKNPKVDSIMTTMKEYMDHTLESAYMGETFFWAIKPKAGDVAEFWFEKPTNVYKYFFRSGNAQHVTDKLINTDVEVLEYTKNGEIKNFTLVGQFDEFGLAEGDIKLGPITAIRLKLTLDSHYWVVISEIELKVQGHLNTS